MTDLQIGWRSPVRADGVENGKWWFYTMGETPPADAQPVYEHPYTVDVWLVGAEPYPCTICGKGREHHGGRK